MNLASLIDSWDICLVCNLPIRLPIYTYIIMYGQRMGTELTDKIHFY